MFKKNKGKLYLGFLLCFVAISLSVGYVNAATFTERLGEVGLDVDSFSNKNSISRYEVARLLNAANCEDCIQAPDWMKQTYTQNFWENFRAIDGKDFDDINYKSAIWNKKSYYYCVAYVGDNGYMAGYPSTSTKCQGKFCGQEAITTSEFYQTVLNIIQNQIRQKYTINWQKVKSWMKGLGKNSIQMKVLNQTDIAAITNADVNLKYPQTNAEFQAWLKYCMYNLSACNFQSFGIIGTGYWPVSELNILYKEGVITYEDAENTAKFLNLKGEEALRIFGVVFDSYSHCSFNIDYDCDGITNGKDNCPDDYNSNQYDLDGDGVGNVCDDDVDGDGVKNQVGIVDDNNHIVISKWNSKLDQDPLENQGSGFSFFINVDAMSSGSPVSVRFKPLTNGNIRKIEWDFGDGSTQISSGTNKVSHLYQPVGNFMTHSIGEAGNFVVKAIATSNDGSQSFAMTKIFVANSQSENYGMNISSSFSFKNGYVNYVFAPLYSGDIDLVSRNVNNGGEQVKKTSEKFNISMESNGDYVVYAKGYKNGEMKSTSMFNIVQKGSPSYATMNINVGTLGNVTSVSTNLVGILRKDIDYISINRGSEITKSSNLSQSYVYDKAGLKTIQQSVVLKDGTTFYSMATITIQNSLLMQSYAVNVLGNRLVYNQDEKMALGLSLYPVAPILSLFTSYQAGEKKIVYNPNLTQTILDFTYSTAGDKILTNSVEVNRCVALVNQGTVHINALDVCETAIKQGTLSRFKCDMDGDKIPDICDDDIDGDGFKNLIGIITKESNDCVISSDNVNVEIFRKQFGPCSLDNSPFVQNIDQADLNNNGIGDAGENSVVEILNHFVGISNSEEDTAVTLDYDMDQDGIPDSIDQCVDVPGNSVTGCPRFDLQECWTFSTCGNGEIDEGETCLNCPQDVGQCCGNGRLEPRETCETCPIDGGICELCGNGVIDEGEDCKNCPEDVGQCTAYCGNGEIEAAETCENCAKDVKMCRSKKCGDGVINQEAGEECDNGSNNGKDGKCTVMCTKYNVRKPNCGNGVIDEGEDCKRCSVDLGDKCVENGDKNKCGNGIVDEGEDCKTCPEDLTDICVAEGEGLENCGNGIIDEGEICENCSEDLTDICIIGGITPTCGNGVIDEGEDCKTCPQDLKDICVDEGETDDKCGNGIVDEGEICENCPEDLTDICVAEGEGPENCGNGIIDGGEDCKNCPEDLMDICVDEGETDDKCGNGIVDEGEDCENCPEDLTDICVDEGEQGGTLGEDPLCGNGEIDDGETCENCPQDFGWCIQNNSCNMCPCEYADFFNDLTAGDLVRAKFWDKTFSVFYNYSNIVNVENYLNIK